MLKETPTTILDQHEQELKSIFDLIKKNKENPETVYIEDCIDILPQISIQLSYDFEDAEKYFKFENDYLSREINMK